MFEKVSPALDAQAREQEVIRFWNENNIFKKSIDHREGSDVFTFYDGPPTANGKPHIGHIETRAIKDLIPRYQTMKGKKVLRKADISAPVYYAELDWTALMKLVRKNKVLYTEVSKYPAVSRDLALLLDQQVEFAQIESIARQTEKKLLKKVELFDVYEGKNLPEGKKSYAVNFILQDETKTLNDKQIDAIMQKLITNLTGKLGAELR